MDKLGAGTSPKALLLSLTLWLPILYLQIPTLLTKEYHRVILQKPIVRTPPTPSEPRLPLDELLKDYPQKEDLLPLREEETVEDSCLEEDSWLEDGIEEEEEEDSCLEEEEEEEELEKCQHGLVLLTGATGSVGRMATQLLLDQGFCVRIFTESLQQARIKLAGLEEEAASRLEIRQGMLGDGSIATALEPGEPFGSVTHILFAAGNAEASDDVHHRGVAECAAAAAQVGTVQSMVVISAAWVSKPYSLASLLYNSLYSDLPSAKQYQGEEALRTTFEDVQDTFHNETTRVPLNYVILRSGRLVEEDNDDNAAGIGLSQEDSFDFWDGKAGTSHSQLAQAAVAALSVQGKYTVEVTSGSTHPNDMATTLLLLQEDEHTALGNQTITVQDVERVHAQAMTDFYNVVFTLVVGTILLVGLLGYGQGLSLSMTLYVITICLWKTFLSNRTVWDCLASELPKRLPLLQVPGLSFGAIAS